MPSMPTSSPTMMTKPSGIHITIIVLALLTVLGLGGLYYKTDMDAKRAETNATNLSAQLGRLEARTTSKPSTETKDTGTYTWNSLQFKYPKGWFITTYDDSFVQDQKNLRVTSAEGELRLGGGPGRVGTVYFLEGFQADIRLLTTGQNLGKMGSTEFPKVQKVIEECVDAGCPSAQYIYTSDDGAYIITIDYVGSDAVNQPIIKDFLASLRG